MNVVSRFVIEYSLSIASLAGGYDYVRLIPYRTQCVNWTISRTVFMAGYVVMQCVMDVWLIRNGIVFGIIVSSFHYVPVVGI